MGSSNENQLLRPGAQPLGPDTRAGRFFRRLGGRGGRRPDPGRDRHRYRRFDPPAGRAVRYHRAQADLRPRIALRHDRLRLQPRPGRPAGAQRRGLRAYAAANHGRFRSARFDLGDRAVPDYSAGIECRHRGLRIGLPKEYFAEGLDAGRRRGGRRRHRPIPQKLGAEMVEISLPNIGWRSRSTTWSRWPNARPTCRASTACASAIAATTRDLEDLYKRSAAKASATRSSAAS